MLPVVHWITRSGWSLVALIWGSFAGVLELIMFNRPTSTRSGHLLHRVNFAVTDNFPAFHRRGARIAVPVRTRWGWAGRNEQPVINTCRSWLGPVARLERSSLAARNLYCRNTKRRGAGRAADRWADWTASAAAS
jgi:hypothetical protein